MQELTQKLAASEWVKEVMGALGGKGGGKADTAQGAANGASSLGQLTAACTLAEQFASLKLL